MTSSKANLSLQTSKGALEGKGRKANDKGKAIKPFSKGKKNIVKLAANTVTTASPIVKWQSNLRDKAKHTAALIQEITEELKAIEEESSKEEQCSEAMQESDLEQEDSG